MLLFFVNECLKKEKIVTDKSKEKSKLIADIVKDHAGKVVLKPTPKAIFNQFIDLFSIPENEFTSKDIKKAKFILESLGIKSDLD